MTVGKLTLQRIACSINSKDEFQTGPQVAARDACERRQLLSVMGHSQHHDQAQDGVQNPITHLKPANSLEGKTRIPGL